MRARHLRPLKRRSFVNAALAVPCALSGVLLAALPPEALGAQARTETPIAPAASIGAVTDAPTLGVLGIASLPDGNAALAQQNNLWLGATQPLMRIGRVHLAALGSGNWQLRDAAEASGDARGMLTLRARTRLNDGSNQIWSAVSYGFANGSGIPGAALVPGLIGAQPLGGSDTRGVDTTVSRRVDVGQIARAEAGIVTSVASLEFAFGMSLERATRVTTQTLTIDEPGGEAAALLTSGGRMVSTRSLRTMQRRDLAIGMASMGFNTGSTSWLISISSPVASWVNSDALAPTPQAVPTVASLAVLQPVTGWLSLFGAAASNPAAVGPNTLRDVVQTPGREAKNFSPVVALGIRISRFHDGDRDGAPDGILAFETRTLGAVDSISVEQGLIEREHTDTDTLRIVLLIDAPHAESVELMGDATSWTITSLKRHTNGRWRTELRVTPGMHRIIVRSNGGKWMAPPGVPTGNDDFGSPVGLVIIRSPQP